MTRLFDRAGRRRLRLGLQTLLGARKGYVIPARHAGPDRTAPYAALLLRFEGAEVACRAVLDEAQAHAGDLRRILRGEASPARFDQDWFPRLDAVAAYALVRREAPRRIVEVGSGHSTRFMAQAVRDGGLGTAITCIDPAPRAGIGILGVTHLVSTLAEADPAVFDTIEAGDILFVDSSHVAMPGSDVDALFLDVLPRLPAGVFVHVHDVFLPDAYPPDWAWRGYNEQLLVGALLQGGGFDILFASRWVATRRPAWAREGIVAEVPLPSGAFESSLWLRKR